MFVAALVLLHTAGSAPAVWRNYEEIFDLANVGGGVLAATNGGLVEYDGSAWKPVPSPSGLRSIDQIRPLEVTTASGRTFVQDGQTWSSCIEGGRVHDLSSGIGIDPRHTWPTVQQMLKIDVPAPPPAHAYSLLQRWSEYFAGTSDGLYRNTGGEWRRQFLPTQMPLSRPNGVAEVNGTFVVGGLGGLFVGRPGDWKQAAGDAIRQIYRVGTDVWVVHGNGALDKIDPNGDQLYPDLLSGNSRRPWTSCVAQCGNFLLFGGMGGWSEWKDSISEKFPPEIASDIVTAIAGRDEIRWVGTEKSGIVRFGPTGVHRWNPGNGLTDTWVTSLCRTPSGLVVGTLHAGLFRIFGDKIAPLSSPTQRVTQLGLLKGALVVGGMDGAWIHRGAKWAALGTHREETTSITQAEGRLAITTASGIYFL